MEISLLPNSHFYQYRNRAQLDFNSTIFTPPDECKNENQNIMTEWDIFKLI